MEPISNSNCSLNEGNSIGSATASGNRINLKWIVADQDPYHQAPQIKNHTATLYNKQLYVFGGYDGRKNHNMLRVLSVETC